MSILCGTHSIRTNVWHCDNETWHSRLKKCLGVISWFFICTTRETIKPSEILKLTADSQPTHTEAAHIILAFRLLLLFFFTSAFIARNAQYSRAHINVNINWIKMPPVYHIWRDDISRCCCPFYIYVCAFSVVINFANFARRNVPVGLLVVPAFILHNVHTFGEQNPACERLARMLLQSHTLWLNPTEPKYERHEDFNFQLPPNEREPELWLLCRTMQNVSGACEITFSYTSHKKDSITMEEIVRDSLDERRTCCFVVKGDA